MRRTSVPVALAAAVLLAGCSSGSSDLPVTESGAAAQGWNPCDGLTAAQVTRIAGERMRERTGSKDQPRCTFVPAKKGGPAYDVSYLRFDGGLDAALDAMGGVSHQLRSVHVQGADAARIAVKTRKTGGLVTGFVQTAGLVQSVNAVQLAPYDENELVRSTKELLALLARAAPSKRDSP